MLDICNVPCNFSFGYYSCEMADETNFFVCCLIKDMANFVVN